MAPKLAEEIAKLRKEVEQLRRENSLERMSTSMAVAELIAYVEENTKLEQLLRNHKNFTGKVEDRRNPWQQPPTWTCALY